MWQIPLNLRTSPAPASRLVNDNDPAVVYSAGWARGGPGRKFNDFQDDIHYASNAGERVTFTFEGTGVDYLAEKYNDHGSLAVTLDGVPQGAVDLATTNWPRLAQVAVFSARGLPVGRHTLELVTRDSRFAIVDAFRVYGAR